MALTVLVLFPTCGPSLILPSLQVMEFLKRMAGTEFVGFSNATWVRGFRAATAAKENLSSHIQFFQSCLVFVVFSQRERPATGIMPSVITWKRRRWVFIMVSYLITIKFDWIEYIASYLLSLIVSRCPCSAFLTMQIWLPPLTSTFRWGSCFFLIVCCSVDENLKIQFDILGKDAYKLLFEFAEKVDKTFTSCMIQMKSLLASV